MSKVAETKIMTNNTVTVPKPITTALDLEIGDHLEWHVEDGSITVKKKEEPR